MAEPLPKLPDAPIPARPKHLPLRLPLAGSPPDLVPARMINEALYCERLLYLEWAQGEFADNYFTVDGRLVHRRADQPGGALPPKPADAPAAAASSPDDEDDAEPPPEPPPYTARSVWLSSERLGITAKIDIVEGDAAGRVIPIEYKRGSPPDIPERAYLPERAQLCAQVLLLRDNGYICDHAEIYFAAARQRVPIVIDDLLVEATLAAARRARDVAAAGTIPPPLVDSPKCNGCSLVGICLPDETNLLRQLEGIELEPAPDAPEPEPSDPAEPEPSDLAEPVDLEPANDADADADAPPGRGELRRLHPARDDKLPLYVQEQGARIGLDGERLAVNGRKTGHLEVRLPNTSQVVILGNVQVTTQALRTLLERNIPISFFSYGGWYYGRAIGHDSKNVELRIAQHRAAADRDLCLAFARGFVVSKIKNSRTMLRRNHESPDPVVLSQLDQLARKAGAAGALEELLGLEGSAARVYFGAFTGMLKGEAEALGVFDFQTRNRRPPKDPINALLSFTYALLSKDFALAAGAVGLDPLLGFYHQPRFGRPALALDLMEEFRPIVADSIVIGVINNGVLAGSDFVRTGDAVALKPAARKRLISAYERRMDQLVTHPVFGYRVSYRRVLEVQARLLGRVLLGELDAYPAFRTR
jgi:CRISP-associated protein Cas1